MTQDFKSGAVDHPGPSGAAAPVPGIRDVFATVLETVTSGISSAAKESGQAGAALLGAVTEVVKSSARGGVGMGSDLVPGSKAIVMGAVRGTGEKGDAALKIVSHVAKIVIHHTADMGGNLAAATKGLVLGAIASAKSMEVDSARAASMAAQGALEGATKVSSLTAERVLGALKEPIGGMKVTIPEPLKK